MYNYGFINFNNAPYCTKQLSFACFLKLYISGITQYMYFFYLWVLLSNIRLVSISHIITFFKITIDKLHSTA